MSEQRATIVAYIEKGLHCFSIGQFEEARSFWNKALELDPHNAQVQEFLQYVSPQAATTPLSQPSAPSASRVTPLPPTSPRPNTPDRGNDSRWGVWPPQKADAVSQVPSINDVEEAWLPQEEEDLPWGNSSVNLPQSQNRPGSRPPHVAGPPSEEHPPFHRGNPAGSGSGQFARFPQQNRPGTGQFEAYRGQQRPMGRPTPAHPQHARGPQRPPSGVYPTPPSGVHPAPPSGVHHPHPTGHGRNTSSGVYSEANPRFGSGNKKDLSTRFLPSLKQQVNPNDLLNEGPPGTSPRFEDDLAAPADAFSEAPSPAVSRPVPGTPATNSGRNKEDLSTRYLQTLSSQQVSPEDLLGEAPSSSALPGVSGSSASFASVDDLSALNVSAKDKSTRMVSSIGSGISPDELKDLIGEDTQDNPSPFKDDTPDTPLSNDAHAAAASSPSLLHIQSVSGGVADRSTRHVPTIRSGASPSDLVPELSPDGPTEVQAVPFGETGFGTSQVSKSEDLSTRMFSPVPAQVNDLLPEDDFLDVELFGESGASPQAPPPLPPKDLFPSRSEKPKDSAFFQEESLSTRLMEPLPVEEAFATVPAEQVTEKQPGIVANDLDFLMGSDSFSSLDSVPAEDDEEPIDVFSEDSIEVVFVSEDNKQGQIAPVGEGANTPPPLSNEPLAAEMLDPWGNAETGEFDVPAAVQAPPSMFETAETGEFEEPSQPVQVRRREERLANVDTGEFEEPSQPIKVRQGLGSFKTGREDITAPQSPVFVSKGTALEQPPVPSPSESQRVPLDPHGPFEPMSEPPSANFNAFSDDPATAETMLAGRAVPPKSSSPTSPQGNAANVFDMPTSAQTDEPSLEDSMGDDLGILLSGIEDLLAEEDFIGAKELLDVAVQQAPENPKIKILYQLCEKKVSEIFRKDFHSLDDTPKVKLSMEGVMALRLNHRDGYILSQIDGMTSIADLLAISGFEEDELFMILGQLVHRDVIEMT